MEIHRKELEEISFRNLVEFYAPRLRLIERIPSSKIFNVAERMSLHKSGVIYREHKSQANRLTPKAQRILSEFNKKGEEDDGNR
jgi:hypothetical protein